MNSQNLKATHRKSLLRRHDSQFSPTFQRSNLSAFDLQNDINNPTQAAIARKVYIDQRRSGLDPCWQSEMGSGAHIEGIIEDEKAQSDGISVSNDKQMDFSIHSSNLTSNHALTYPQDPVLRDGLSLTATEAETDTSDEKPAHRVSDDPYTHNRQKFQNPQAFQAQVFSLSYPSCDESPIAKPLPHESFPDGVRRCPRILTITDAM